MILRTLRKDPLRIDLRTLLPAVIVVSILALSAFSGWKIQTRLPILVGLGVILITGGFFLLRLPIYGLILLIPVSFFVHRDLGTGTLISMNGAFLLTFSLIGLWSFRKIVLERELQLAPSSVNLPVTILVSVTGISMLVGNTGLVLQAREAASLQAQLGGWLLFVLPLGLLLITGNIISDMRWLRNITWIFIILGSLYVIGVEVPYIKNVVSDVYHPRSIQPIFRIWLVALAFGQALWNKTLPSRVRLLMVFITLLLMYYAWKERDWIVGWTTPLLAIMILIWLRNWRWGLISTLAGFGFYLYKSSYLISQLWDTTQQYSTISRTWTWPIMWELIKFNPITGLGPANYYYYTPLFPIDGYYVNFNSHNNYIDIIAQYGFLGLIVFAWMVYEIGRTGWRLHSNVIDGFSLGYVNAALAGLAATLVSGVMADWFLPFLYNIGIPGYREALFAWLFLGGLLALDNIQRNHIFRERNESG